MINDLIPMVKKRGFSGEPTLFNITEWLRIDHVIIVFPVFETLGSDEWCFAYEITWLPKEFQDAKRRCPHFQYEKSLSSSTTTYYGGWDSPQEAIEEGIKKALTLL